MSLAQTQVDLDEKAEETKGFLSKIISEFSFIHGNFLILILTWLIMDFATEIPSTYYALYVKALGGSAATIGLIGFASMISLALVQFLGGYLADKHGRKKLVSTMTFGMALSYVFYALAPGWHTILLGAIIQNLCLIYRPALNALLMDSLPPEKRGMGFSITNLITSVSTTPAPLIAGWLYVRFGLVSSMRLGYILALLSAITAAILRLRLKETIKNPEPIKLSEVFRSYPKAILESFKVWEFVPNSAFFLFVINIMFNLANSLIGPIILLYVVDDLGISPVSWSKLLTVLFISMIVSSIPLGKLVDRMGRKASIFISQALWMVAIILLINGNLFRLFIAMPLVGMLNILSYTSISALFADLIPKTQRGKAMGFRNFFSSIIMAVGQLLGGVLYDKVSHLAPLLLQFVLMIPSLVLTLILIEEPKAKED